MGWYNVTKISVPCSERKSTPENISVDSIQNQPPELTLKLSMMYENSGKGPVEGILLKYVESTSFHWYCVLFDYHKIGRSESYFIIFRQLSEFLRQLYGGYAIKLLLINGSFLGFLY